jgi:hypothetical protein
MMSVTTTYGSWVQFGSGGLTIEDNITDALGEFDNDFDLDAIAVDYRQAINDALPTGVQLIGDHFVGPHPMPEGAGDAIRMRVELVDADVFWTIAAQHEKTVSR